MDRRIVGPASAGARAALPLAVVAALVLGAACHGGPSRVGATAPTGRTTVITRDEIVRMGAHNAWEVVRARAPHLYAANSAELRIQEPRSVNADETPLVVVDGVQAVDLSWLTQIPASEIAVIRIMDAEAAEPLYGLRAAGGAIVIETRTR